MCLSSHDRPTIQTDIALPIRGTVDVDRGGDVGMDGRTDERTRTGDRASERANHASERDIVSFLLQVDPGPRPPRRLAAVLPLPLPPVAILTPHCSADKKESTDQLSRSPSAVHTYIQRQVQLGLNYILHIAILKRCCIFVNCL